MKLFIARFESSNFVFEGFGDTELKARTALRHALNLHCRRSGAKLKEFYYPDEVDIREIQSGWYFIDRERAG